MQKSTENMEVILIFIITPTGNQSHNGVESVQVGEKCFKWESETVFTAKQD